MTRFYPSGPLKLFRRSARFGTHGRQSSGLLRLRPPLLPTHFMPGLLFLLCLLLLFKSLCSGHLHLFGFGLAAFLSLAQLAGIEFGVALAGMLLANEEMVAETGGYGRFLAFGTVRNDMLAYVAAETLLWHSSMVGSYQRCLPPLAAEGLAGVLYLCPILEFLSSLIEWRGHMTYAVWRFWCSLLCDVVL